MKAALSAYPSIRVEGLLLLLLLSPLYRKLRGKHISNLIAIKYIIFISRNTQNLWLSQPPLLQLPLVPHVYVYAAAPIPATAAAAAVSIV